MTDLPPGWTSARLGEVSLPVEKVEPKELGRPNFRYVDIGSVDGNNQLIADVQSLAVEDAPSRARQLIRSGDTVFSTVRPYLKKIGYVSGELDGEIASTGFCVLRPGPFLDSRYLFHLSYSDDFLSQVLPKQRGVSYPAVRPTDLFEVDIPLPPLAEQRRIVVALEDHLSRLDAARLLIGRANRRIGCWRLSLFQNAVRGRIAETDLSEGAAVELIEKITGGPAGHIEGPWELPLGWAWARMGELFRVSVGSTPSRADGRLWDGGVPWVSSGEVAFCRISRTKETIAEEGLGGRSSRLHPRGTVLLAMIGEGKTRGQAAILDVAAAHNQNCASIRVSETPFLPEYIYAVLAARYDESRRSSAGGNQPALNKAKVQEILVPTPPLATQRRIVAVLDEVDALASKIGEWMKSADMRSAALRSSLLRAAFAGRLVSQDADDEPASELLARIRAERAAQPKAGRGRRTKTVEAPVAGRTEWPDAGRTPVSYEQEELL